MSTDFVVAPDLIDSVFFISYYGMFLYSFFPIIINLVLRHPLNNILQSEVGNIIKYALSLPTGTGDDECETETNKINLDIKLCLLNKKIKLELTEDKTDEIEGGGLIWYVVSIFHEELIRENERNRMKEKKEDDSNHSPVFSNSLADNGSDDDSNDYCDSDDEISSVIFLGSVFTPGVGLEGKNIKTYAAKLNEKYMSLFNIEKDARSPLLEFALEIAEVIEKVPFL
jgi:hypothetical protein